MSEFFESEGWSGAEEGPEQRISEDEASFIAFVNESGLSLNEGQYRNLVRETRVVDLKNSGLKKSFEVGDIAMISTDGRLFLDESFNSFNEDQKRHLLAHELAHRLDLGLEIAEKSQDARMERPVQLRNEVLSLMNTIRPEQVSWYQGRLTSKADPENPQHAALLAREGWAELCAQYVSGGRTFEGFMSAKLRQFPSDQLSPEELSTYQASFAEAGFEGSFEEYFAYVNDENYREEFLDYHPGLRVQYEIWKRMDELFSDPGLLELEFPDESVEPVEDDHWLVEHEDILTPPLVRDTPPVRQVGETSEQVKKKAEGIDLHDYIHFWRNWT